jgi:uncharacterized Zn finger protein
VRIVEAGDATIIASCEGSGGNVYRQTIHLRESAKGTLLLVDATCTCPVHNNCKHCAVLLQVQETLEYPAAAKDAELLENSRPYWTTAEGAAASAGGQRATRAAPVAGQRRVQRVRATQRQDAALHPASRGAVVQLSG